MEQGTPRKAQVDLTTWDFHTWKWKSMKKQFRRSNNVLSFINKQENNKQKSMLMPSTIWEMCIV